MAYVPAICRNCGLVFPSGFPNMVGAFYSRNASSCPRCKSPAEVLDGYTALINGMVTFIASPRYSLREKQLLIEAATEVGKGRVNPNDAAQELKTKSKEGGRLLREWGTFGLTVVTTMATVASFILAYSENKGNAPLEEIAAEKFDEVICAVPQPDKRQLQSYIEQVRPVARPLFQKPELKESDGAASSPKPPNENRKARRARVKKERSKFTKR